MQSLQPASHERTRRDWVPLLSPHPIYTRTDYSLQIKKRPQGNAGGAPRFSNTTFAACASHSLANPSANMLA